MERIKFFVLFLIIVFMCIGCGHETKAKGTLPLRAVITDDLGNGWVYFELDGRLFLFNKEFEGYRGYMALTEVSK